MQPIHTAFDPMVREMITTPAGLAYWAKVFDPEENRLDPSKPRSWSVSLALKQDSTEALQLMTRIEEAFFSFHGKGAKQSKNAWPFKEQTDREVVLTGLVEFRFKKNETTKKGNTLTAPAVYDAKKGPWPEGTLIGNGSTIKVAFSPWGWEDMTGRKGISLSLEAVQVLDLVPYESMDPRDAFDEEDGYVADPRAAAFDEEKPEDTLTPSQRIQRRAAEQAAWASKVDNFDDDEEAPF